MKQYQLKIFETNINDGIMHQGKKFYPKEYTEEDAKKEFLNTRTKLGKKHNFDGRKILQPKQKDVEFIEEYPDGKYIKINDQYLHEEDLWQVSIPSDILMIDTNYPNIVIGHRHADCPIIIAEDRKNQIAAVAHCGARQINREVPKYIIEALEKEVQSNPSDIYVYVGTCIKKESYIYDCYPMWATNTKVWKNCIEKIDDKYHIDLIHAIKLQLLKKMIPENNINISPYDTYKDKDYYSHTSAVKNDIKKTGQNFVGCFYQEKE